MSLFVYYFGHFRKNLNIFIKLSCQWSCDYLLKSIFVEPTLPINENFDKFFTKWTKWLTVDKLRYHFYWFLLLETKVRNYVNLIEHLSWKAFKKMHQNSTCYDVDVSCITIRTHKDRCSPTTPQLSPCEWCITLGMQIKTKSISHQITYMINTFHSCNHKVPKWPLPLQRTPRKIQKVNWIQEPPHPLMQ